MFKFHSAILSCNPIPEMSYRSFWDNSAEYRPPPSKWPLKLRDQRYPKYDILLSASPKFHLFRSTAKRFRVTGQFETSAPNDPKMTINTERSKWPHMYITNESQISLLSFFALLPDVFKLQTILRQVHRNDSQITWNTTLLEILQNL